MSRDMEAQRNERRRLKPTPAGDNHVKNATQEVRMGFVRKVYGILSAQLLLTVAIATPMQFWGEYWMEQNLWLLYVSVGMTFATLCALACCADVGRSFPLNYIFLLVFTGFEGVMIGFVSASFTWQSVVLSAGITVFICLFLTIYAWTTTSDFTGLGPYLFAFSAVLLCFGLALCILTVCRIHIQWLTMLYDALGVLLFVFYIVFDTQRVLGEYGGHMLQFSIDDYAFAALNLYLDVINLFLHILAILGRRK